MRKFLLCLLCLNLFDTMMTYGIANTWTQKNDVAYPVKDFTEPRLRREAATFTVGGKGYLCGGLYSLSFGLKDAWAYDSLTGGWTQLADMPAVCGDGAAFAIGSKGYVGTGTNQFAQASNQFFEYDVSTNTWSTKANFGGGVRRGTVGFSVGSKGYIGLGNTGTGTSALDDIWEYDPTNNSWTQRADFLGSARTDAVSFTIGSKAYVGTGETVSTWTKDLYEFNPATNVWISRASLPSGASIRTGAIGFAIGSRGYITTGLYPNAFYPFLYDCYEYNPTTNTWTNRPTFPGHGRVDGIAMAIGSRAYVGTGIDAANDESGDMRCYNQNTATWSSATPFGGVGGLVTKALTIGSNGYIGTGGLCDLRKYFPSTDSWQSVSFYIDTPRSGGVAFCIGSKGYFGLGTGTGNYGKDLWEYNPLTNAWTQKANFPGASRVDPVAFGIGSSGYVGMGSPAGSGIPYYDFWRYTPATNSWAIRDSFPGGPRQAANCFVIGKKGYVTMGKDYSNSKSDTWEYYPATNSWTQKANFPVWRDRAYAFSAGSKGYVGLGYPYVTFYQFDPLADTWTPLANYPSHTRGFGISLSINGLGYIGLGSDGSGRDSTVFWQYEPDPSILSLDASDTLICHNQVFTAPFNMGGVFDTANNFILQISDSLGSFAGAMDIGSLHATLSGTISSSMPSTIPPGNGYRMRVVSTNPAVTGTVIDQTFSIRSSVTPAITISPSANPSCQGNSVSFTSSIQNGGNTPTYVWKLNGTTVGGNSGTYANSNLQTGNRVWCVLTSSISCAIPPSIISDTVVMTVLTNQAPVVQLSASADSICAGTSVTYTATAVNAYNPIYNWYLNGAQVQSGSGGTYINTGLLNNDSIWVILTSGGNCNAQNMDTSVIRRIKVVSPPVFPSVSVLPISDTICSGITVLFQATAVNGGGSPTFQWMKNGSTVGINSPNYSAGSLASNDSLWVILTSNALCAGGISDTSDKKIFTVLPNLSPGVTISPSQNNICTNTNVTFTATDNNTGGNIALHQWQKNGNPVGGDSNIYNDSTLVNGDIISCQLSGIPCASPTIANSNQITMIVATPVTPNIAISTVITTICSGVSTTFNSSVTGAGSGPVYEWFKNGLSAGSTGTTYVTSALATGDVITCVLSVNPGCVTKTSDTSNSISMTVTPTVIPTVSAVANKTTVCQGESVTFTESHTNGGSNAIRAWLRNGTSVFFSGNPYTTASISNADAFSVRLTSNAPCASPTIVISAPVSIAVTSVNTPVISQSGNILSSNSATGNHWYLDGSPISAATGQSYLALQTGNYTVLVTDINGCSSAQSNAIHVSLTGIEESAPEAVSIFPNPASVALNIVGTGISVKHILIYNLKGQLVINLKQPLSNLVDISQLEDGVYVAEIRAGQNTDKESLNIIRKRWVKLSE